MPDSEGGAIYDESGTTTVNKGTFGKNSAEYGGGIYEEDATNLVVNTAYFQQNIASSEGGGVEDYEEPMTLNNTTFSHNSSGGYGGGVYARETTPRSAALPSITIAPNTAAAFTTITTWR